MEEIRKVCVIGAGVMGAGIAAQAANAGAEVLLLDVPAEGDRNAIAKGALQRLRKTEPAALMHPRNLERIEPGNIDDHLPKIAGFDWIIEAVVELLDVKRDLYARIEGLRGPGSVVSSNTSTLPLADLTEGLPKSFRRAFLITHFFNPPRYMRLLEIVTGPETASETVERVRAFADRSMGKNIVAAKDTPGFIANRIGTFWLQAAVTEAVHRGIGVEEADAVLGRPVGIPKTGVFGLLDLVGLDLMPHILDSLSAALPIGDAFHALGGAPELLHRMILDGYTGRKGKGGFYRLNREGETPVKEVIDLATGAYSPARRPKPGAAKVACRGGLRALVEHQSAEGRYAWAVLSSTLGYAASLVPEIAEDIEAVDHAMRLGYNWKHGPFELLDRLGTRWFEGRLREQGGEVPRLLDVARGRPFYRTHRGRLQQMGLDGTYRDVERPEGVLLLEDVKRRSRPLASNRAASLWDVGDGVACLEFHTKMNALDPFSLSMIERSVAAVPRHGLTALVLYNEGSNFSAGANIAMLLVTGKLRLWPAIDWILRKGQRAFARLREAPFPVVGAPSGMALGGGCEVLLHCDAIVAHAETYMGLVEAGVGIVPGWGGCASMLERGAEAPDQPKGPMPPVMKAFETIAMASVSRSADQARGLGFLRSGDDVVMNRDRLLAAAKEKALDLARDYQPPAPAEFRLPGPSGRAALDLAVGDFVRKGVATDHDATVARALARVLTGGDTDVMDAMSADQVRDLERAALIDLARTPETQARVAHMLKTGKPLRN